MDFPQFSQTARIPVEAEVPPSFAPVLNTPTVTVVVPNYNHAHFLPERLDSILRQTFQDFELIRLDDCSTDV